MKGVFHGYDKEDSCYAGLVSDDFYIFCRCYFSSGDKGNQITTIQQALANYGYDISVDGDYGASTQAAVRQFQEAQGLEADGIVGAATYEA